MSTCRVENWKKFSEHMEEYIQSWTVEKYNVEESQGCDLMSIIKDLRIYYFNILKYALRLWNGHAKDHDLQKICHYAEMAWNLSQEKAVKDHAAE